MEILGIYNIYSYIKKENINVYIQKEKDLNILIIYRKLI